MVEHQFPRDFKWGVATSAYQIEGSTVADGRGESIWDRFASKPGAIEDGSDGSVACDHYRRWASDIQLMSEIGVNAYRFSIAWPRVFPKGWGSMNQPGLDFYDRLVDGLLAKGIDSMVTLYHWDLPQTLQDRDGWAHRDTAKAFTDYAFEVARRLGDRVKRWVTHNSPRCVAVLGYELGRHAPGVADRSLALAAGHHVLLSHGFAVRAMREAARDLEIGLVHTMSPGVPASDSEADREAAREFDEDFHRWFVEPVALGQYPDEALERYRRNGCIDERHPVLAQADDLAVISTPTDFMGVNYFTRAIVRADIPEDRNAPRSLEPAAEQTDTGWEVYSDGLFEVLMRATNDWRAAKIYITECGAAYVDGPGPDGTIQDQRRIEYLQHYFRAARLAIGRGAPLAGLFVWSLLDNFEWTFGLTKRFGLVWVDHKTQERTLKESARWYREVINSNGF